MGERADGIGVKGEGWGEWMEREERIGEERRWEGFCLG